MIGQGTNFLKHESGQTFLKLAVRIIVWGGMAVVVAFPNISNTVASLIGAPRQHKRCHSDWLSARFPDDLQTSLRYREAGTANFHRHSQSYSGGYTAKKKKIRICLGLSKSILLFFFFFLLSFFFHSILPLSAEPFALWSSLFLFSFFKWPWHFFFNTFWKENFLLLNWSISPSFSRSSCFPYSWHSNSQNLNSFFPSSLRQRSIHLYPHCRNISLSQPKKPWNSSGTRSE